VRAASASAAKSGTERVGAQVHVDGDETVSSRDTGTQRGDERRHRARLLDRTHQVAEARMRDRAHDQHGGPQQDRRREIPDGECERQICERAENEARHA
jgi:hypothetical protein